MRLFHISDLHIGKRVCGFSMLEDQRRILQQVVELARTERADGVLIAGDLYDRTTPPGEAVELLDWFLSQFAALGIPVWAISGNHDSPQRVAYGGQMLGQAGIHVSRVFDGSLPRYELGTSVDIYLMPFLRPAQVRPFFPEQTIETTQQAVQAVLARTRLRSDRVNILVMHQFLAGAAVCDSEELSVGGTDQVDASVVAAFDYVALGHLHRPQSIGRETVRYCGSPLKYSFSEAGHEKSLTVVEIAEAGQPKRVAVRTVPLAPRHDLREIRGPIDRLMQPEVYLQADREDYLHVTLTDEGEVLDAVGRLREAYPNLMRLDFERSEAAGVGEQEILPEEKTPEELFAEFFFLQNGKEPDEAQRAVAGAALRREKGWEQ